MNHENRVWNILGLIVGLLTAAVPAYVAYDVYGRGPIPEKQVELFQLMTINPLQDLSVLGQDANFVLKYQNQTFKNLVITNAWITNKGRSPILPGDFYEHLSVSVDKPWKIIAVEDKGIMSPGIRLHWKRVTDTRFEADPTLLNPGDRLDPVVYMTNTDLTDVAPARSEPALRWNVRIANLREFSSPPNPFGNYFGVAVQLTGWALPFTLLAATLFQALYLRLLVRGKFLRGWGWWPIILVLLTSLLAYAAAESSATYLFPESLYSILGVDHWINAPWIILHVIVVCFLYWKARQTSTQD
jgi:hypothetical protein